MTGETHVLLVDDEPAICKALVVALSRAGYRVTAVMSAEGANAVLRDEHVDALVVDFRIPDMRGDALFELASAIQPHLRRRTMFTTGDITLRAQELIEATGCHLLRKPFELSDLIEWVRGVHPKTKDQTA